MVNSFLCLWWFNKPIFVIPYSLLTRPHNSILVSTHMVSFFVCVWVKIQNITCKTIHIFIFDFVYLLLRAAWAISNQITFMYYVGKEILFVNILKNNTNCYVEFSDFWGSLYLFKEYHTEFYLPVRIIWNSFGINLMLFVFRWRGWHLHVTLVQIYNLNWYSWTTNFCPSSTNSSIYNFT
jgi:hypothetical protein